MHQHQIELILLLQVVVAIVIVVDRQTKCLQLITVNHRIESPLLLFAEEHLLLRRESRLVHLGQVALHQIMLIVDHLQVKVLYFALMPQVLILTLLANSIEQDRYQRVNHQLVIMANQLQISHQ